VNLRGPIPLIRIGAGHHLPQTTDENNSKSLVIYAVTIALLAICSTVVAHLAVTHLFINLLSRRTPEKAAASFSSAR
jgi:hypothetical protein